MWSLVLNAFLKYVRAHPEVIEQLLDQGIHALLAELTKHNNTPPQP